MVQKGTKMTNLNPNILKIFKNSLKYQKIEKIDTKNSTEQKLFKMVVKANKLTTPSSGHFLL